MQRKLLSLLVLYRGEWWRRNVWFLKNESQNSKVLARYYITRFHLQKNRRWGTQRLWQRSPSPFTISPLISPQLYTSSCNSSICIHAWLHECGRFGAKKMQMMPYASSISEIDLFWWKNFEHFSSIKCVISSFILWSHSYIWIFWHGYIEANRMQFTFPLRFYVSAMK